MRSGAIKQITYSPEAVTTSDLNQEWKYVLGEYTKFKSPFFIILHLCTKRADVHTNVLLVMLIKSTHATLQRIFSPHIL
jgi:hypothetical protein